MSGTTARISSSRLRRGRPRWNLTADDVPDRAAVPAASAGCPDPASVQGICNPLKRCDPSPPDLVDDRQYLRGVLVGHSPPSVGTGPRDLDDVRVAQTLAPVLLRLEGLTRPVGNQSAFLLGQGGPEESEQKNRTMAIPTTGPPPLLDMSLPICFSPQEDLLRK